MLLPDCRPCVRAVSSRLVCDGQEHVLAFLYPLDVHVDDLQFRRIDLIVG
jgi:hypothetical protein